MSNFYGRTQVFDSGDPNLPNLPEEIAVYSSDSESDDSVHSYSSDDEDEGAKVANALARAYSRSSQARSPLSSPNIAANNPNVEGVQFPGLTAAHGNSAGIMSNQVLGTSVKIQDHPDHSHDVEIPFPSADNDASVGISSGREKRGSRSGVRVRRSQRRYSSSIGGFTESKRRAGWEPGVDIRTTDVILNSVGSQVTIVDYSSDRYKVVYTEVYPNPYPESEDIDGVQVKIPDINQEFVDLLKNRPAWSKVRWINVNGLSWEAISVISREYQLHRLAIEDMVDIPQRTKADKYPSHTFCVLPLHKLISYKPPKTKNIKKRTNRVKSWLSNLWDSDDDGKSLKMSRSKTERSITSKSSGKSVDPPRFKSVATLIQEKKMDTIYQWSNPSYDPLESQYLEDRRPLSPLNKAVGIEQVSLFLTNQNTVISFFEKSAQDVERPILSRLSTESTILRESVDPSILLQAIIDGIVDLIHPIISAYRDRVDDLELDGLINPTIRHSENLHMITAELTMLRNTIVPITSLLNSLRDHSAGKDAQVMQLLTASKARNAGIAANDNAGGNSSSSSSTVPSPGLVDDFSSGGRISELAYIYLSDVADHVLSYTQDLDVMRLNVKASVDLIFNIIAIRSSDSVKILSFVTVIFLPLSFLTGYFGMNFKEFGALDNSASYYWAIAIPFCAVFALLLIWQFVKLQVRAWMNQIKKSVFKIQKRRKKAKRERAKKESLA